MATLMRHGIVPDIIICRSRVAIPEDIRMKIAFYCHVQPDCVFQAPDLPSVYYVPLELERQGLIRCLAQRWQMELPTPNLDMWIKLKRNIEAAEAHSNALTVAIVGKYTDNRDAYKSLHEAIKLAGYSTGQVIHIKYLEARDERCLEDDLKDVQGVVIAGGFGFNGITRKISVLRYCRTRQIPCLGICLGFQLMAIEYVQACGYDVVSEEWNALKGAPLVKIMDPECKTMGGTMRLGAKSVVLDSESKVAGIYDQRQIRERHRHRYDLDSKMYQMLTKDSESGPGSESESGPGLKIVGWGDNQLPEVLEHTDHPFYIGVQYHPEYTATVAHPHPLFVGLIQNLNT